MPKIAKIDDTVFFERDDFIISFDKDEGVHKYQVGATAFDFTAFDGELYFIDTAHSEIGKITPNEDALEFLSSGMYFPDDLQTFSDGLLISGTVGYTADDENSIFKLTMLDTNDHISDIVTIYPDWHAYI